MVYSLYLEKQVTKFLSKLDKNTSKRIFDKIENLTKDSIPSEAKRIVNINDKVFRIRVGTYRILYRIEKEKIVVVFLIDKRSKVYNKINS